MKLDLSRLEKVRRNADGSVTCRCVACKAENNGDSTGNHLRIWQNGSFNCVTHTGDRQHNAFIRAYLRGTNPDENPDYELIDPEPKISVERVYPESSLDRLVPDYSYWEGRGIKPEVLARLEGGMAPEDEKSKLSARFIFPIRGLDRRIVGFTGRLTFANSFAPTWKHIFRTSKVVWPWHVAEPYVRASGKVILVESIGDLLSCQSHDIMNVLCIFGLNINGKLISTLVAANVKQIIISLNRDEDPSKGQRAAEKIRNKLSAFFNEESLIIRLPPEGKKDWNECSSEEIEAFKQEIK